VSVAYLSLTGVGYPGRMSLMSKLSRLARSPQGRRMARQAMDYAKSPEGQRRIADVRRQLAARRKPKLR
jgi:hypothetical protein